MTPRGVVGEASGDIAMTASPKRDQASALGEAGPDGKRIRTVGALAVVDEHQAAGSTARNRDVDSMDPEKVQRAKAKELGKLRKFESYEPVHESTAVPEMVAAGGKKISTRWEIHEADGEVKARFVCRALGMKPN